MSVLESMSLPEGQQSPLQAFPELLVLLKEVGVSERNLSGMFSGILERSVAVGKENLQLTDLDLVIDDSLVESTQITQEKLLTSLAQVLGKLNRIGHDVCEAGRMGRSGVRQTSMEYWTSYLDATFREKNGGFVLVLSINQEALQQDKSVIKAKKREQAIKAIIQGEFGLAFDVGMDLYVVCESCGTTYSIKGMKAVLCPQCNSNLFKPNNAPAVSAEGGALGVSRKVFQPEGSEGEENDDQSLLDAFTRTSSRKKRGGIAS